MKAPEISQEQVMKVLDQCYDIAVKGLAKSKNCTELANEYLDKYCNQGIALTNMVNNQNCNVHNFWILNKPWRTNNFTSCITSQFSHCMVYANQNDWGNSRNVRF